MDQGFGQSYNRRAAIQCPELPDPCAKRDAYASQLTSRGQTRGGTHNCPPEKRSGREVYGSPSDNKQTYNHPPPHTTQDTYHCPPDTRRETYAIPTTPVRGRDTYAMPQRRDVIYAPPAGGKRGTYDVPQEARRGTYGLPRTPRQGTYTPPGSGSPEIAPQYLATMCPDADLDEERRRLKEDFRSMQTTPWTMEESVMTPPWGEGAPPLGGVTPGDTMGGCLEHYPIRETPPWDRDCEVFSSPDTAVSLSPLSKRALPPSPRSASPQSDGTWSSAPSHYRSPSPTSSPAPENRHPTPCSPPEQRHPTPCSPPEHVRARSPATPARHPVPGRTASPPGPGSSPVSSPGGVSSGYPSSGSPGSVDSGLTSASPGTPSRRCADGTNLVKPTLDDMLCAIKFGAEDFVADRMQHVNEINLVITKAIDAVRMAQSRMGDFERVMDDGTTMITPFVNYWGEVAEYFGKQTDRCLDPNRPAPNLKNINHPSRQVNQKAYCDLLWQMVLASQAAERGVRAQDLGYGELDEQLNHITEWLRLSADGLVCHVEKNKRVNEQFLQILTTFNDRRRRILAFLEEWQCGGDELNEPALSPADRPCPPALPEIPPNDSSFAPPTASTPCGSPSSGGLGGQNAVETGQMGGERADRLRERAQALQEMVRRFSDMQSHAMHEVLNIQNQNSMLEQSLNAMENVRSAP